MKKTIELGRRLADMTRRVVSLRAVRVGLMLMPGLLSFVGYVMYYRKTGATDWAYALFSSLRVYAGTFDASYAELVAQNLNSGGAQGAGAYWFMRICLEVGRWGGLIVTGTFIFRFAKEIVKQSVAAFKTKKDDAIAVHGSAYYTRILRKTLGSNVITLDIPEKFHARRHVLAFDSDDELLAYLSENFDRFPRQCSEQGTDVCAGQIYLCLQEGAHSKYSSDGVIINNTAEDCARLYWRDHYIHRHGSKKESRIVIIGFGHYGQAILSQALMVNVFLRDAPDMEYHIFGDAQSYVHLHQGLKHFVSLNETRPGWDAVFFHDKRWENNLDLLEKADRIILADDVDQQNIRVLSQLNGQKAYEQIHIRSRSIKMIRALYPQMKIVQPGEQTSAGQALCVFGMDEMLYTREMILDEKLLDSAKRMHANYIRHNPPACCVDCAHGQLQDACIKKCGHFAAMWNKMSLLDQRSNIMAADHMPEKVREVLGEDCRITEESLLAYERRIKGIDARGVMDPYLDLEHRRWMRYMFLCGWNYADIAKRDADNKLHPRLVPYDQLPEGEWKKDKDAYIIISDLLRNEEKERICDVRT